MNIQPTLIERSGGAITISLDPPLPIERVHIGAAPCLPEQSAPYICRAPAWSGAVAAVDVIIDVNDSSGPRRIVAREAIRYALPDFVQWPGDPLGPAVGVLRDGNRLILTRADAPPDVVAIGPRLSIQSTLSIPAVHALRADDLDGDGALDLLGLPTREAPFRVDPTGAALDWWTPAIPNEAARGLLIDLDGDGFSDLAGHTERQTSAGVERRLMLAPGGPTGFEVIRPALPTPFAGDVIEAYAPIDADGDGDADLIICGAGLWVVIMEDGQMVEARAAETSIPCGDVRVLDVNRDGRQDIAWVPALPYAATPTAEAWSGLFLLRGDGVGFTLSTAQPTPAPRSCSLNRAAASTLALGRSRIVSFDVDLDGDVDLFLPAPHSQCAGDLVWYESAGDRFLAHHVPGADADVQPTAALATDLDGDGDLDVVVAAAPPGDSRVWRNLHVERGGTGAALIIRPTAPNRSPRGASVRLVAGGEVQQRWVGGADRVDGPVEAHFGLGLAEPPYAGVVRWPDGLEVYFEASAPGVIEVPRPDR